MIRPADVRPGIYRAPNAREWQPIEIIGQYPNGKFLVQETGRVFPGRFIASRNDLRVECLSGREFTSDERHTGAAR